MAGSDGLAILAEVSLGLAGSSGVLVVVARASQDPFLSLRLGVLLATSLGCMRMALRVRPCEDRDDVENRGNVAVCICDASNELVSAECEQLTGHSPDANGLAFCDALDLIPNAAYVRYGARRIVQTETLDALTGWLARVRFQASAFRLELLDLSSAGLPSKRRTVIAVADAIHGRPDLTNPERRFQLIVEDRSLWFGEIAAVAAQSYLQHATRPGRTSSSLPTRLARALVNLVARDASSIVNPCCGTGSILLEACAVGLKAHGADWNPRMTEMSRQNLAHFGYDASVELINARAWTQTADALIADLPYGNFVVLDEANVFAVLQNAVRLAPLAVFVAVKDISDLLRRAGFRDVERFRVQKSREFTRYVHRARS